MPMLWQGIIPILWDLRIINIDGKTYNICNNCCDIGIKNGTITDNKD
jgi:hypothetical protein